MNGVIVIDKPAGFTSFDVVALMRGLSRERKVGHTGTLDPMATGVLPLLLGSATRALPFLQNTGKEYEAGFRLGASTDTQDSTGKTLAESGAPVPRGRVEAALPRFRGEILQTPPMYSALSVNGERLYDLARRGVEVAREARPVTVSRLELAEYDEASRSGRLRIACSKGTYIRTICSDLGDALGVGGVMTALRRTAAAGFSLADAVTLEEAKALASGGKLAERLLPVESLFPDVPTVRVTAPQAARFCNGGALELARTSLRAAAAAEEGGRYRVLSPDGVFLGLAEARRGELKILRLFRTKIPSQERQTSHGNLS